ncbi:BTAD domain-containing putative transcriptional regulator [Micromonospora sp. WMMD1102]|uniref:AfsR/SARP family transcriptional regulator n=1 Tax=Micromonospora sp. WMMD1102 TaxID=3016105 RepID=UPI0024158CD6|nr:BTAD domain-containing putative transcriptional regulator [Micromonospora sp. WMMD1102]MDG4784840.1 BTAD domain-containing putative transcriptional regulator [Micromonospora sp. WMMD1102]
MTAGVLDLVPAAPRAEGGAVRIRLLGTIGAERDGRPLYLGPARQRELLAILGLRRGGPVSVEQLVDDLWGEDAPRSADNLLHTYLGRLRRALGTGPGDRPVLRSRCPGYQLDVRAEQVDSELFERRLGQARTALATGDLAAAQALLHRALDGWSGPRAMDGATGPLVTAQRCRLGELRLDATEDLLAVRLARGDSAGVVAELRALVARHPLRERLWALLLAGLARSSRRGEALAAFHDVRGILTEQLGVDPSAELQQSYRSLLHGSAPAIPLGVPGTTSGAGTAPGYVPVAAARTLVATA